MIYPTISITLATPDQELSSLTEPTPFGGYFIFGFMTLIDPEESTSEFEIVSFTMIIGNGENIRLNQGEMIKIYVPIFALIFNNLFIGYIGDYSIIG